MEPMTSNAGEREGHGAGAPAGPADPSAVMSARGVVKRFGDVRVLNGISMDVRAREVVV